MSGTEHENQELERAAAAYRRLPRVDPPPGLDAAVLAAARRAVARPAYRRWPVGVASAAVVVLAVGLGWRAGREALQEPASSPPPLVQPIAAPPAHEDKDASVDEARKRSQAPLEDQADAGATAKSERANVGQAPTDDGRATAAGPASAPTAPTSGMEELSAQRRLAEPPAIVGAMRDEAKEGADAEAVGEAERAPEAFPREPGARVQTPAAPPAEPEPVLDAAPPAKIEPVAGSARPQPAPADAAGVRRRDEDRQKQAAGRALDQVEADKGFDEIRRLLRDGDTRLARERLRELVARHPDVRVPDDLVHLLR